MTRCLRDSPSIKEYPGKLNFATDTWTSPNHRSYVAFTVHLEKDGVPLCLLLDFVEVPRSHSGFNLAMAFAEVLREFGLANRVSRLLAEH